MKFLQATTLALTTSLCSARFIEKHEANQVSLNSVQDESLYRIELSPGETRLVTEEQKWELKRKNVNFMDITDIEDPASLPQLVTLSTSGKKFPEKPTLSKQIKPLLETLSKLEMKNHLEVFSGFHTRYYNSKYGAESSKWLLGVVNKIIVDAKADHNGASVKHFKHPWGQNSIIANFPGKSNKTIVIGAHQDSINLFFPSFLAAPGADDDGSGTVTILEAMRVLLTSKDFIEGNAENTVEFHWYSAEEGGMLGSQAVFQDYRKAGRDVRAMLQQDMTGYIQKTLDAGEKEHVGIITDFVDPDLTDYIKKIVTEYADIPYTETKCGYACSDHSSASKFGYPSAFVIESDFKYSERPQIHTTDDTIKYLDFDHMLQHAKLTLGFVYELAYAKLL